MTVFNTTPVTRFAYKGPEFSLELRKNAASKEAAGIEEGGNFTDCDLQVMIDQTDRQKHILFGGLTV